MNAAAIITLGHRRRTTLHTAGMRSRDSPRESLARSPASNLALSSAVEVASCPSAGALASSGRSAQRCGAPRGPTLRSRASAPPRRTRTRATRAPRRKIRGRRWFAPVGSSAKAQAPPTVPARLFAAGGSIAARADGRRGSDREGMDARDGVGFDRVLAMRARAGVVVDGVMKVPIYIRVTWLALNNSQHLFLLNTRRWPRNTAITPLDQDPTRT